MLLTSLAACLEADAPEKCSVATWWADADTDGFGNPAYATESCAQPEGYTDNPDDCDDADAAAFPGAAETCDGRDEDCDDRVDDDASDLRDCFADQDADGLGDASSVARRCACEADEVEVAGDCNDLDSATGAGPTWYADADGDGFGDPDTTTTACAMPDAYSATGGDCDDARADASPIASEVCNDADDDCDGEVDEDDAADPTTWWRDRDGDGWGGEEPTAACAAPEGHVPDTGDCDDTSASISPGATETCSGIDEDCDGLLDADDPDMSGDATWYLDEDGDGHGTAAATTTSCERPDGFALDGDDCDDADGSVFPGADETCDDADQDCDGAVDESAIDASTWYEDLDGDSFGGTSSLACDPPADSVADGGDCDDLDAATFPGASEACDGGDDDCDGAIDDNDWYADVDDDGYGDATVHSGDCAAPSGYVADATDCDDTDALVSPGGTEACGGGDEDCDGLVDDDDDSPSGTAPWYADADGDGFGAGSGVSACDAPAGHVASDDDCDDTDLLISPSGTESCGGGDEDCDGFVDDDDASVSGGTSWYADVDADGYGAGVATVACSSPAGSVADDTDCDDGDATVSPGAYEVCADGADQDCDGVDTTVCDADGDGYDVSVDCDDLDADRNPGEKERCDDADTDEDCDGDADDDDVSAWTVTKTRYYRDDDGDGYGDSTHSGTLRCDLTVGVAASATDCDDADPAISPGAAEVCGDAVDNAVDNDCSGAVDDCTSFDVADAALSLTGTDAGDHFGRSVGAGDIDGDGVSELFVGAYYSDWTGDGDGDGAVYLFDAGSRGTASPVDASADVHGAGGYLLALYGLAVHDADDDGLDDLLVSSPGGGYSFLFYAGDLGGSTTASTATASARGPCVAWPTFLDTDGDLVLEFAGAVDTGGVEASIYQGPFLGSFPAATCEITNATSSAGLYNSFARADLQADGLDDLLMYRYSGGGVYAYLDGCSGSVAYGDADQVWAGAALGDGSADLTGDGAADLVLSENDGSLSNLLYVLAGPVSTGSATVSVNYVASLTVTMDAAERLEAGALVTGDFDGDGGDDLALGNSAYDAYAGAAVVIFGGWSGSLDLSDVPYEGVGALLLGSAAYDYAGIDLANAGDTDGDGADDLLVGTDVNDAFLWLSSAFAP